MRALIASLILSHSYGLVESRNEHYLLDVESGKKPGDSVVIGGTDASVGTSLEDLNHELTAWTWLTSGTQMTVSSTDVDDDSDPADTGARTVLVTYLDTNYAQQTEIVQLDGQTGVATTATNILRVNSMAVISAGTSEWNEGAIYIGTGTVTNGVPAVIHGTIQANESITFDGKYTVPAGKSCYLIDVQLQSPASRFATFSLSIRLNGSTGVRATAFEWNVYQQTYFLDTYYGVFTEKTDVWWRAKVDSQTGDLRASFKCLVLDN